MNDIQEQKHPETAKQFTSFSCICQILFIKNGPCNTLDFYNSHYFYCTCDIASNCCVASHYWSFTQAVIASNIFSPTYTLYLYLYLYQYLYLCCIPLLVFHTSSCWTELIASDIVPRTLLLFLSFFPIHLFSFFFLSSFYGICICLFCLHLILFKPYFILYSIAQTLLSNLQL